LPVFSFVSISNQLVETSWLIFQEPPYHCSEVRRAVEWDRFAGITSIGELLWSDNLATADIIARSLPLDDVRQPPGILVKLELQLALFIDDELRGREKNAATLALVTIIQVDLSSRQIETLCLGTPIGFAEGNLAVSDKTDGPARRRDNFTDVAKIESEHTGDRYPAHAFHLLKGIHQSVVLPLLE